TCALPISLQRPQGVEPRPEVDHQEDGDGDIDDPEPGLRDDELAADEEADDQKVEQQHQSLKPDRRLPVAEIERPHARARSEAAPHAWWLCMVLKNSAALGSSPVFSCGTSSQNFTQLSRLSTPYWMMIGAAFGSSS